jgi:hypothetical protein
MSDREAVWRTSGSEAMRFSVLVLALVAVSAWADDARQPRTLGNQAVMHIYYYAPKTLEVTYVDSYLFKDEAACKDAIPKALQIAVPYASDGDLVSASCVGMTPPAAVTNAKPAHSDQSTEL